MRLLEETKDPDLAKALSDLLNDRKIEHKVEHVVNTNWGDDKYGDAVYKLWVIDEDLVDRAEELIRLYKENPDSDAVRIKRPRFQKKPEDLEPAIPLEPEAPRIESGSIPVTRFVIILCIFLFLLQNMANPLSRPAVNSNLYVPSIVEQELLFDYPEAAQTFTSAVEAYYDPKTETVTGAGQALIAKAKTTPYWDGFYDTVVLGKMDTYEETPWFEKISQGEFWRLITPAFLHGGLLHILFNLLWFWMLGKEIEKTIGLAKTAIMIVILAVASNTCQYLMTGFQFLGLSGVVAGYAMFIGERQRVAPWEGYTLQRSVYYFLFFYIFGIAAFQAIVFLGTLIGLPNWSTPLANTAHVAGAIMGFILGRLNFFAWKG